MPLAAAWSSSGALVPSVPQVRTVLTPSDRRSAMCASAVLDAGPNVTPLIWYAAPFTDKPQLPWLPVTLTTLGPFGIGGAASGGGVGPVVWKTPSAPMLSVPPADVCAL